MNISLINAPLKLTLVSEQQSITLSTQKISMSLGVPGIAGAKGEKGADGGLQISTDPNNRLTTGIDSGAFVPEWDGTDPLAYYILAKN